MKRNVSLIAFVLLLTALASAQWGCSRSNSTTTDKGKNKLVVPVEIGAVISGDIAAYFTGTATVEAEQETEVVAKVGGVVERILVEEGDYVQAGQVIAKLDEEKIAVQLEQAQANLARLENSYRRNEDLHAKQLVSTEVFQQAKYDYEQQKAAFDLARLDLKYTDIRTPIAGVVAERLVKVGNMILPNQPVYRVTGLDPLIAVLHVPEKQISRLRVGQESRLQIDALPGADFTGRIKRLSPVVDPGTGTVKVTVEMRDPSRRLRPGMFARVKIIYDVHENTVLAPKDAIMAEDRESAVFVVQDSIAVRRFVTIGYENTTHVEILEGLLPGDTLVTTGKSSLKDSSTVDIVSRRGAKR
ncbi:MAG: efflux RND transporter periplasmic adaptor subunit [Candidatus Krumholzibacteriota bacterium]|nr:efflux RND transporter periplasmic adaptor subunit [Candidatus Krumholzibacteriota bacterium]